MIGIDDICMAATEIGEVATEGNGSIPNFMGEGVGENVPFHEISEVNGDLYAENGFMGEGVGEDVPYHGIDEIQQGLIDNRNPAQNKREGIEREKEVEHELEKHYPEEKGYQIYREVYLRDENGNIMKDPVSGEARRIDFVVVRNEKIVDSIEVTSQTAPKEEQMAKERRIRDAGGEYIKTEDGTLVKYPKELSTRIERRK